MLKDGLFQEMKKRAYYEKPSVKRKRKSAQARKKRRKALKRALQYDSDRRRCGRIVADFDSAKRAEIWCSLGRPFGLTSAGCSSTSSAWTRKAFAFAKRVLFPWATVGAAPICVRPWRAQVA